MSRGDISNVHVVPFALLMSTEFKVSDTQSKFTIRMLCLQLTKQEYQVSRGAMLSVITRICFKHRKDAMVL